MKQKILLGVMITSIFLALFTVNVMASEEETTTSTLSVLDNASNEPIETIYTSYYISQYNGTGNYLVYANIQSDYIVNGSIYAQGSSGIDIKFGAFGSYLTLDDAIKSIINGELETKSGTCSIPSNIFNYIYYSSHDIYIYSGEKLVFQQAPLMELSTNQTVGKMTPQQIIQATMKQKVYLLPFLIVSVVGFLAFRKGLAMLFRTLGKA